MHGRHYYPPMKRAWTVVYGVLSKDAIFMLVCLSIVSRRTIGPAWTRDLHWSGLIIVGALLAVREWLSRRIGDMDTTQQPSWVSGWRALCWIVIILCWLFLVAT